QLNKNDKSSPVDQDIRAHVNSCEITTSSPLYLPDAINLEESHGIISTETISLKDSHESSPDISKLNLLTQKN
ncbi:1861_t:CDS:1, partial [Dentiscutata heterogama]